MLFKSKPDDEVCYSVKFLNVNVNSLFKWIIVTQPENVFFFKFHINNIWGPLECIQHHLPLANFMLSINLSFKVIKVFCFIVLFFVLPMWNWPNDLRVRLNDPATLNVESITLKRHREVLLCYVSCSCINKRNKIKK